MNDGGQPPKRGSQLDYYEFMGYDSSELRRRYTLYADRFHSGAVVLDVGCGRGEFLQLLADREVNAVGIDADAAMVEHNRAAGRDAVSADAIEYLANNGGRFDGVFAAHLIEHMPAPAVEEFIGLAVAALRPAGRLIVVTPNPANLGMHLRDFWIDLQHVRFYAPPTIRWLFHAAGLGDLEDGVNPAYRLQPGVADLPGSLRAPKSPPARSAKNLGLPARLRQRLGEWLEPASSLERITDLELHINDLDERIAEICELLAPVADLWPPGEFYVTGVKQ